MGRARGVAVDVQTATFVFTDLVDSTATASSLGPRSADELRRTHLQLLRSEVTAAGGVEVKTLGDGLMAVFASASRAVAAAVAMQRAIHRHNRRAQTQLAVRIGISMGEVTAEDNDFFGEPVVEASRLCSAAEGGQILCAGVVRTVVGRHLDGLDVVDVGSLNLKGLPRPVPAVEVRWEPDPAGDLAPLPSQLRPTTTDPLMKFHGRSQELEAIDDARERAFSRAAVHAILLAGEPGIGKTSLAAEAARRAHAEGAIVLFGAGQDGIAVPYAPWIVALTDLIAHDLLDLTCLGPVHGESLRRLLPHVADRLPGSGKVSDPTTQRFLLLNAVTATIAAAAATAPVVVVLDDLHWADAASLQQLRHLLTSPEPAPVLVLATLRDTDVTAGSAIADFLADLHRVPRVDRVSLRGLSDAEVLALVETAAGRSLTEPGVALAQAVWRESDGNPFFVGELLRHLGETDMVVQDPSGGYRLRDDGQLELPNSVREVVAHRVARLGEAAERMLSTAAVIGREFDVGLLSAVTGIEEDEVLDVLERATAVALVVEDPDRPDRYRFVHAIIGHTLEAGLSSARRRRIHERVAIALERTGGVSPHAISELARHWMAAARETDPDKAREHALQAGDSALRALAPVDAARLYEQALELVSPGDAAERCRVLVRLSDARRQAGDPAASAVLLEASRMALELQDVDLLAAAALCPRDASESQTEPHPERIAVIEAALAGLAPEDVTRRARLLSRLAEVLDPRGWHRRQQVAEEAVQTARAAGEPEALLDAFTRTADARTRPDNLDVRLRDMTEAMVLAQGAGDVWLRAQALNAHISTLLEAGQLVEGETRLRDLEALADETRLPAMVNMGRIMRTALLCLRGDLVAAEAAIQSTLEIGTIAGATNAAATYGVQLLEVREQQGRVTEVLDYYEELALSTPAIAAMRARLVELYCHVGRLEDARNLLSVDAADGFSAYPFNITWLGAMARCAEAATTLREVTAVQRLHDLLSPFADRVMFNIAVFLGPVARTLGRTAACLGQHEEADAHFRSALECVRGWDAPYWIARVLIDRAESLGTDEARELLVEARELVTAFGYNGLQRRLAGLRP